MSTLTQQQTTNTHPTETTPTPHPHPTRRLTTFARKNPAITITGTLLSLIILTVLIGPLLLPSPLTTNLTIPLAPPGTPGHPLGTDEYGRDILSRLINGGRVSLGMGILVATTSGTVGVILGLISGYFPKTGGIIMRISDAWMAFPAIILAMLFSVVIGPGILTELLAIGIMSVPFSARVMRSRTLEIASRPYVEAARVSGMGPWKTLATHIFPHVLPLIVVQTIVTIAGTMLIDGGLSFLGMGIAPPAASWGNMISDARTYMTTNPNLLVFPGLTLALTVFLVNMLGTSLRPLFDPQTRALNQLQHLRTHTNNRAQKRA